MKFSIPFVVFMTVFLSSCETPPPPPIIIDTLVLDELQPKPREIVVKKEVEYEPVFASLKIIEVSEENGVQKKIIVRIGPDRKGLAIGVKGDIAEDEAFQKVIGTYRITELFADFFTAEIEVLNYKIGSTAWIRYKIGEKIKGGN